MYVTDRPLEIDVERRGEAVICKLAGSATMDVCHLLNDRLADTVRGEPRLLVLDLGDLEFICSLGLGGLVATYLYARQHQGRVVVAAPHPAVRELLELTRLTTLMPIFATAEEALRG
ncbi:MAG TPA: STAS domain-containing protein [Phycisphaerae bacterium]|nr:STAS domain-containing protein [Phycisphaerae bacterium]